MALFETLGADVFADPDPENAFTTERYAWATPAGIPAPSGIDGGFSDLDAGTAAAWPPVDPGEHAFAGAIPALRSNQLRRGDTLSHFIGNIYNAALDSALWPQVLAAAADYVGGQAAGLLSKNTASAVCTVHHQFGFESGYVSTYRDEY